VISVYYDNEAFDCKKYRQGLIVVFEKTRKIECIGAIAFVDIVEFPTKTEGSFFG